MTDDLESGKHAAIQAEVQKLETELAALDVETDDQQQLPFPSIMQDQAGAPMKMPEPAAPERYEEAPPDKENGPRRVSQSEFDGLHSSVRGRAKVEEVNLTLGILQKHFAHPPRVQKRGPAAVNTITMKELDKLGGRVTGTTGKSILSILQRFGFVTFRRDVVHWQKAGRR